MVWGHVYVLVAPKPMWREAEDAVGASLCPTSPQIHVEGAEGGAGTSMTLMLTTTTPPKQTRPTAAQCGDNHVPSVHRSHPPRCCSMWMRGRTRW